MRRLSLAWCIALAMGATAACGGDDDDGGTADAGPDAGGADAMLDAGGGAKDDFAECAVDDECAPTSDCRQVGWFSGNFKVCMPRCQTTAECPFNTFCYPDVPGQPSFAFMKDHCWFSLCGPDPGVGTINGACKLGEEVNLPAGEQLDGFCVSINDASFGQCVETGSVAPGGACDFANPTRGGANCDQTSLCLGQQGQAQGTCFEMCDPEKILSGAPGNCGAVANTQCLDRTEVRTIADAMGTTVITATFAYCDDVTACSIVGANTCPAGEGCVQTNPARPTGVCDPAGFGEIDVNAACTPPQQSTPAAQRCDPGSICFGAQGATTCQAFCDRPASGTPVVTCGGGTTCAQVLWDEGTDTMAGTADDNLTQGWGLCQ